MIISLQPTIATAQSFVPNDSATITVAAGGGDLAGNVVFKLYVNDATCTGAAAYTSPPIAITGGTGSTLSKTVLSNNTTSYGATGTTFHWVVEYTSTNPAHQAVTSAWERSTRASPFRTTALAHHSAGQTQTRAPVKTGPSRLMTLWGTRSEAVLSSTG